MHPEHTLRPRSALHRRYPSCLIDRGYFSVQAWNSTKCLEIRILQRRGWSCYGPVPWIIGPVVISRHLPDPRPNSSDVRCNYKKNLAVQINCDNLHPSAVQQKLTKRCIDAYSSPCGFSFPSTLQDGSVDDAAAPAQVRGDLSLKRSIEVSTGL